MLLTSGSTSGVVVLDFVFFLGRGDGVPSGVKFGVFCNDFGRFIALFGIRGDGLLDLCRSWKSMANVTEARLPAGAGGPFTECIGVFVSLSEPGASRDTSNDTPDDSEPRLSSAMLLNVRGPEFCVSQDDV